MRTAERRKADRKAARTDLSTVTDRNQCKHEVLVLQHEVLTCTACQRMSLVLARLSR